MASFTAGYGPKATISDNGSDKVRVTFEGFAFDWELYEDILVDSSHYIYNQTQTESAAITAKGCVSATAVSHADQDRAGFYFDLDLTYSTTTWVTNDRCVPTFQVGANNYNTVALAMAALANNDTLIVWFGDLLERTNHDKVFMNGLGCNVFCGLSRQRVTFTSTSPAIMMSGDLSGVTSQLDVRNFTYIGNWSSHMISFPTVGSEGSGAVFSRFRSYGGGGLWNVTTGRAANLYTFHNFVCIGQIYSTSMSLASLCEVYYGTIVQGGASIRNYSLANVYTNIAVAEGWSYSFFSGDVANAVMSKVATWDAMGSEVGLQSVPRDSWKFWRDNDNGHFESSGRITTSSILYHAGTPVVGIDYDIDGNTRDAATPSIGAHEGAPAYAPPPPPSPAGLAVTPGTTSAAVTWSNASDYGSADLVAIYDSTSSEVLGRFVASAGSGIIGPLTTATEYTVHAVASAQMQSFSAASAPVTFSTVSASDASPPSITTATDDATGVSATLALVAAAETDNLFIYRRLISEDDWTLAAETRVGSGDLTVAGLTPGLTQFIAVASAFISADESPSAPSVPAAVMVTDGPPSASGPLSLPVATLRQMLADCAAFRTLCEAATVAEALEHVYYPILEDPDIALPFAMIGEASWGSAMVASSFLADSGALELLIEAEIPAAYQTAGDERSAYLTFVNSLGSIITELKAMSGEASRLAITSISYTDAPERTARDDEAEGCYRYAARLSVEWGIA